MKKRGWSRAGIVFLLSISLLLLTFFNAEADEVKYIYDDLGRLYQVIDQQGNVATYNYDAVGNLFSITQSTGGIPAPTITSISPNNAQGGDKVNVTITGDTLTGAQVKTDNSGIGVSNVKSAANSITMVFALSYIARQGSTNVTVTTPFGSDSISFTVTPPPPVINALQPASGPVTRIVKIVGTGFDPFPSRNQVEFNGVMAPVYSSSPYSIMTAVPVGATSGPVTVTTYGSISNGVYFNVISVPGLPPTIVSITPNAGSVKGGDSVTITGSGFTWGTNVYIGGNQVKGIGLISSTLLNVATPPGVIGPADVLLTNINGDVFLPGAFTYVEGPPHEILAISPTAGLTNIPVNTPITVLFSRPVDRTTLNSTSFSLLETSSSTQVLGDFSFDFDDTVAIFRPVSNLKPNTNYTLYITRDIKSVEGMPLDRYFSETFTTGESEDTLSPTVTVMPENGSTGVPINTRIIFNFSESINQATLGSSSIVVTNNGTPVEGDINWGYQNSVAVFTSNSMFLQGSTVNVTLSHKITDIAGNPITGTGGVGTDLISSFTTGYEVENTPPKVMNIIPSAGAVGVDLNTPVSVTFDEPINPLTVNSETFTLSAAGIKYSGRLSFSNKNTMVIFTPDYPFPENSLVIVKLANGISDMAGNSMSAAFASTFTTIAFPRLTIWYPGPATLNAGDMINVIVTNEGEADTTSAYTVKLSDVRGVIIYQDTITDVIKVGMSKNYGFQIPTQAADGAYYLYGEATDSLGKKTTGFFIIHIIGVNATLNARTDKDRYLVTEIITGLSSVSNGQFAIEEGNLNIVVGRRDPSAGKFFNFLPKKGWANLSRPDSIAAGPDGSIYVADRREDRIQKFDGSGNFIAKWGSSGDGDGQFYDISQIGIGPDGSIYVSDSGKDSIQKFDSNGNFITKWNYGEGENKILGSACMDVAPDGSIYVGVQVSEWRGLGDDRELVVINFYVQKFDSDGNFIAKWGSLGTGDGQFRSASGMAIGPDGHIYVSDSSNNRIQKFDSDGNFVAKWGSRGSGDGEFENPRAIAVGSDSSIYVIDYGNSRIQKFDSNGNFIKKWGSRGSDIGQFDEPEDIAVGQDGSIYVADRWNDRIQKFDQDGNFVTKWGMDGGSGDGEFNGPDSIAVGLDGSIYVADSGNGRIQKFDAQGNFVAKWQSHKGDCGEDGYPFAIAVGPDGSVYVASGFYCGSSYDRIHKFDGDGKFITQIGSFGSSEGHYIYLYAISVGPDGSLYVTDWWPYSFGDRVQKFDSNGNFIRAWGHRGSGDGEFSLAEGIAVGPDSSVYVADTRNHRVQKFDSNGKFLSKWGSQGSGDGQFLYPYNIAVGPDGSVYVADGNDRIQRFDQNGNFVTKWGNESCEDGDLESINAIAVGPDGAIYTANYANNIQRMIPEDVVDVLFQSTLPVNQQPNTIQDYVTNIGQLNAVGTFYLKATILNKLGQTITQSLYPFEVWLQ